MTSINERKGLYAEEEYAVQCHKISPYAFQKSLEIIMKWAVEDATTVFAKLIQQNISNSNSEMVFSLMIAKFNEVIESCQDRILKEAKDLLLLPPGILLGEDVVQRRQYSDSEISELRKKTVELKKKYLYNKKLLEALHAEVRILQLFESAETKVNTWHELIKDSYDEMSEAKEIVNSLSHLIHDTKK